MGALDGRVAIITGAGRGVGREHALLFAAEGAKVVVNDLGGATDGAGADRTPAQEVVDEIVATGGEAIVDGHDISDSEGARQLVAAAVERFGDLHVLVNNAGILRDRMLVSMSDDDWDSVVKVHLRGTFETIKWAAAHWREQSKAGHEVNGAIVNTSSASGLFGNLGQANYAAAKAGIVGLTLVVARELSRYGVRCNAIAPMARTRLTLQTPGFDQLMGEPDDPAAFDIWHPANISPLVAYLATASCPLNGGVFHVVGDQVGLFRGWTLEAPLSNGDRWSVEGLAKALDGLTAGPSGLLSEGTSQEELIAAIMAPRG